MEALKIIKSHWVPYIAIGLLVLGFWSTLFLDNKEREMSIAPAAREDSSSFLALPGILAPVIRNEVHQEKEEKEKRVAFTLKLPSLQQIFKTTQ